MKNKKKSKKSKDEGYELIKKWVAFGNNKKVFWRITLSTVFLTLIGIPAMIKHENFLKYFLLIWILEIIYIWMYVYNKRKNR